MTLPSTVFSVCYIQAKNRQIVLLKPGVLDKKTWTKITQALASGRLPPQNTVLGGNLGIHGIGKGDKSIHEQFNWTNGCIALTNEQIETLSNWVKIGTLIEIQ